MASCFFVLTICFIILFIINRGVVKVKKLLFILLLCVTSQSQALEIAGVKLEEELQLENHQLVLNGAGIRTKFFVKVYAVGLYLSKKAHTTEAVLADTGANRISMHMMREVTGQLFVEGLNMSLLANQSEAEMKVLDPQANELLQIIGRLPLLQKGDIINLDYIPGLGTKVVIKGVDSGIIEGLDFNRALLKIWLGKKPVKRALKEALLGEV